LALTLLWLAVADRFVDPALTFLEHQRYERGRVFRFENSDLFGLGPLVEYLRQHPTGERPRTLFFGNSVVWGYGLAPDVAAPAQLQGLEPETKVFNVAINGFEAGSSYLIARAVIDSVDRVYVLLKGDAADPMLPSLIPIEPEDLRSFNLPHPDRVEQRLERSLGWWHLYRSSYRLQAALFGSSTRQYIYLHKGELARSAIARVKAASLQETASNVAIELSSPMAAGDVSPDVIRTLEHRYGLVWRLGSLARDHAKRAVLLHIDGYSPTMSADDIAAFNRVFAPRAETVVLRIPSPLTFDGLHLTSDGSRALSEVLLRHERAARAGRRP
jgi:hypothetical protein